MDLKLRSQALRVVVSFLTLSLPLSALSGEAVSGEYIVKMKPRAEYALSGKVLGKAHLKAAFPMKGTFHLSDVNPQSGLIEQLKADPDVEYVEPNFLLQSIDGLDQSEQMDAQSAKFYDQTGAAVKATEAWAESSAWASGNRPIVAVVDTGLDKNHPVFSSTGAIWVNQGEIAGNGIDDDFNGYIDDVSGWNFIANSGNFHDDEGHGTHVSGIVLGATQDILASSLEPAKVRIMPLKFLDANGAGSTAGAVNAITYAVNMGAKVINCSWGGGSYSRALHDALAYAYNHGVVVVTAAGNYANNNDAKPLYPANYDVPSNISVAASSDSDRLASFSNYGSSSVHIAAPGVYVFSTVPGGWFRSLSGTSMAAPFIAGLTALAWREATQISSYQIKSLVLGSVDNVGYLAGKMSSGGRINAQSLLLNSKSLVSAVSYQPGYQPVYQAERTLASEAPASSSKGGGCGLISAVGGAAAGGGGASGGVIWVLLLSPLLAWVLLRLRTPVPRRRFDRYVMNSEIRIRSGDRELVGTLNTISLGGLSFNVDEALEKGGQVKLMVVGPDGQEAVEVEGRIVWSERDEAYGVQFEKARDGVLSVISSWTRQLVRSS